MLKWAYCWIMHYNISLGVADKCQKVVFQMIIYDTFVTCFTSYSGKSREKSDYWPITLYSSYSTHLCRNWVPKYQARTKKNKSGQKLLHHGEQKSCQAKYSAWRSNGELNGEQFQRVGKTGQEQFVMASQIPARRKRRFHLIRVTWQKPTGKESSFRHGEPNLARREVTFQHMYKSPFSSF